MENIGDEPDVEHRKAVIKDTAALLFAGKFRAASPRHNLLQLEVKSNRRKRYQFCSYSVISCGNALLSRCPEEGPRGIGSRPLWTIA